MFGKTVKQPVKPRHVDALDAGVSQIDLQVCVGMNRVGGTRLAQRQRHFDALHADPVECNQGRGHFRQGNVWEGLFMVSVVSLANLATGGEA